jgi:hypothetical protein
MKIPQLPYERRRAHIPFEGRMPDPTKHRRRRRVIDTKKIDAAAREANETLGAARLATLQASPESFPVLTAALLATDPALTAYKKWVAVCHLAMAANATAAHAEIAKAAKPEQAPVKAIGTVGDSNPGGAPAPTGSTTVTDSAPAETPAPTEPPTVGDSEAPEAPAPTEAPTVTDSPLPAPETGELSDPPSEPASEPAPEGQDITPPPPTKAASARASRRNTQAK